MWTPIVEIDYTALAKHIVRHAWSGWSPVEGESANHVAMAPTPDITPRHAFEVLKSHLKERTQQFMDFEALLSGEDEELLQLLMAHYTDGHITDITVSAKPGIVVRLDEGTLILPLILIKLEQ